MKRVTALIALSAATVLLASGCAAQPAPAPAESPEVPLVSNAARALLPADILEQGYIDAGTSGVEAPWTYTVDGTEELTGFDVELAEAIGAKLDIEWRWSVTPFAQLIAGIDSDRIDVAVGNLGDTAARADQLDFVDYVYHRYAIAVLKGNAKNIQSITDICGNSMAQVEGSTSITDKAVTACADAGLADVQILSVVDASARDLALQSGRVDANVYNLARAATDETGTLEYIPSEEFGNLMLGFGVKEGNTPLAEAILQALVELHDDGTYAGLLEKYGIEALAQNEPGINIGSSADNY